MEVLAFSVSCILFGSSTNVACVSVNICRNLPLFLKIYTFGKLICIKIIYRHFALQHLWRFSVLGICEKLDCVVIVSIINIMVADINTFQGINSVLYFYLTQRPVGRGRVDQKNLGFISCSFSRLLPFYNYFTYKTFEIPAISSNLAYRRHSITFIVLAIFLLLMVDWSVLAMLP